MFRSRFIIVAPWGPQWLVADTITRLFFCRTMKKEISENILVGDYFEDVPFTVRFSKTDQRKRAKRVV